jgi:hypothetical protein
MKLQHIMLGVVPFVLVGAYWHVQYIALSAPRQVTSAKLLRTDPIGMENAKATVAATALASEPTKQRVPPTDQELDEQWERLREKAKKGLFGAKVAADAGAAATPQTEAPTVGPTKCFKRPL